MNNLAELWEERQKRKVKPYSRYGNARKYCREINMEINSKSGERLNKNDLLTSMIYELITPEIRLKLEGFFGDKS